MKTQAAISGREQASVNVREATPDDAETFARIFYDAFESIATRHRFPIEPTSREFTRFKVSQMLADEGFAGLSQRSATGSSSAARSSTSPARSSASAR
jgi:hypothetical protein